jgi:hypothetical protein
LSNFDKVTNEVTVEVADEVTDEVDVEVTDEIIKTETKLNETNSPLPPKLGGEGAEESFSEPPNAGAEKEKSSAKKEKESGVSFEEVWALYERKGNKKTSERRWANLKNHCREAALKHIPRYVAATPDIQFRKNFETYLNQEAFNDEIITRNETNRNNNQANSGLDAELARSVAAGIARARTNQANG